MYVFVVLEASNFDLDNIITPVDPECLNDLLLQTNYDDCKREYLVNGFRNGFSINYKGPLKEC